MLVECPMGHRIILGKVYYSGRRRRKFFKCPYCRRTYPRDQLKIIRRNRGMKLDRNYGFKT